MTLCVAAPCMDKKKPCIVVSSDFKAEIGDVAGAEIQNKMFWIYEDNWPVLISNTASSALALIGTYREVFQRRGITKANVYDRLSVPPLKYKEKRIDAYVHARTGKSYEYFRTHPLEFDETMRTDVWGDVRKLKLGCDFILSTFIAGDPFIFWMDGDTCEVHRDENFLAIGTGATVATSVLCFRGQNEDMSVTETLYNVYEATRYAYKSKVPGVGRDHAFSVLYAGKGGKIIAKGLRNRGIKLLEKEFGSVGPQKLPTTFRIPVDAVEEY